MNSERVTAEEFIAAIAEHGEKRVMIEVNVELTMFLLTNLQLALRHPGNVGASANAVRDFVAALEQGIGAFDPALAKMVAQGWIPHESEVSAPPIVETRNDGSRVQVHPPFARTYFVSALAPHGNRVFAKEIKAESFAAVLREALSQAEEYFGDQVYRLTCIVEQPELSQRGPVSLALEVFEGRAG